MTWSLPDLVEHLAAASPGGAAIREDGVVTSWAELRARAAAAASSLGGRGVVAGDRVALVLPPSAGAIAALLGVLRVGAVAAPLDRRLTGRERRAAIGLLAPAAVLDEVAFSSDDAAVETSPVAPDPEAPAVVVLTSGTTGTPKGVVLSGRALAASADAWLGALPAATGWAMPLGLAHVAGLGIVWRAIRCGVPVAILPAADPAALLAALSAPGGPSHVSLVPVQLARLLDLAGDAPPPHGVRAVLLGGGSIPPALVTRAAERGWPVVPTYGLSEMGSGVTALPAEEALEAPHTAGRGLPGMSVSVEGAGHDGVGEIVARGPARSSGYVGGPSVAATEPVHTGDLGRLDDAGRLVVVDRRTDRIVRGGENVDPGEVEAVLEEHPAVEAAGVVGLADDAWGRVPVAAVVLRPGTPDPGDEALAEHARAALARYKVPVDFVRVDALPRTAGGKLRRDAVRALLAGDRAGELARPGGEAIGWRVTGSGPRAVVLLPGTLSTARQLDRLATALAAPGDLTVHALDRRGSGTSRLHEPRPLDVAIHVDDLVAYLDARRIARAALVGVSFGGVLAIEAAARRPERVDRVVAWEPPYGVLGDEASVEWFRRVAEDTARAHADGGPSAAAETFLRQVAGDDAWDRLPDRARAFLRDEGDGALADSGLTGLDAAGLASVTAPLTILTGTDSEPFYRPIADELVRRVPAARLVALDGLGHTAPITDSAPVAGAIRSALDQALALETPR